MGNIYYYGWYGESIDLKKAVDWYSKAADNGNAYSCIRLGEMYCSGLFVTRDCNKALNYYMMAVERGDSSENDIDTTYVANCIAEMYLNGSLPKDGNKAAYWYRKNALRGSAEALYMLGEIYFNGLADVYVDICESVRWYEMAAKMDCPSLSAQLKMAYLYENGIGVSVNKKHALEWYKAVVEDEDEAYNEFGDGCENLLFYVKKKISEISEEMGLGDEVELFPDD